MHPAVAQRKRKEARPELYCSRCLWMTGGGDCHRHGGPPWTEERAAAARKRSRGEGLTAEEWTLLGVSLPIPLPVSGPRDVDAESQPSKAFPDRYDHDGRWIG